MYHDSGRNAVRTTATSAPVEEKGKVLTQASLQKAPQPAKNALLPKPSFEIENAAAELPRRWSAELTACTKPITLLRRLRELQIDHLTGPDVHFAHLDSLADGPIYACGEQMQVLRSKHNAIA